jgi:tellurite methyltransferase
VSDQLWKDYLRATSTRGPRPLLERALAEHSGARHALDLGCGAGGDTLSLLQDGFRVLAVDALEDALVHTRRRAEAAGLAANLETRRARFEDLELEAAAFQLIVASFSLPFCAPEAFDRLWSEIGAALVPGGVFAGQFFGDRDEWVGDPDHPSQVFLSRAELERLLAGYELLDLEEVEERRTTALGGEKDWHFFHVMARKAPPALHSGPHRTE